MLTLSGIVNFSYQVQVSSIYPIKISSCYGNDYKKHQTRSKVKSKRDNIDHSYGLGYAYFIVEKQFRSLLMGVMAVQRDSAPFKDTL